MAVERFKDGVTLKCQYFQVVLGFSPKNRQFTKKIFFCNFNDLELIWTFIKKNCKYKFIHSLVEVELIGKLY